MKASPQRACRTAALIFQNSQYKRILTRRGRTARRENCFFGDLARVEVDRNVLHGCAEAGTYFQFITALTALFREDGVAATMSNAGHFSPSTNRRPQDEPGRRFEHCPQEFGILRFYRYKYPAIRL